MIKARRSAIYFPGILFILALMPFIRPGICHAFFEWHGNDRYIDLRGAVRAYGITYHNPDNDVYFSKSSDTQVAGLARLLIQSGLNENLVFEGNIYQTCIPDSLSGSRKFHDVERSSLPEWSLSDDRYAHLAFDRFNIQWTGDRVDLTIGRQPVNLATTFHFSPNDLFAPFAAQTFYRAYKPGVDALRSEIRLGDFSQLSLISVLGYANDPVSDTGWSRSPDSSRNSYIARTSAVLHDFEWTAFCGRVRNSRIAGGSLQGELFKWLGLRAEGHHLYPAEIRKDSYSMFTLGVEHRWNNSLNIRLEQFYNGSSTGSISEYSTAYINSRTGSNYPGRHYTALGVSYEFTPLMTGCITSIANLTDNSFLISLNSVYSLTDESELSFTLSMPSGREPEGHEVKSEFGMSPCSFSIEMRYYF